MEQPQPARFWNEQLGQALIAEHRTAVEQWERGGRRGKAPQIPEQLGQMWMALAHHIGGRSNFVGYSFRDDAEADGIARCVRYWDRYDGSKGRTFSFFSRIIFFEFLKRIKSEQRYREFKAQVHVLARHHRYTESPLKNAA